jgi:hypothetical protein
MRTRGYERKEEVLNRITERRRERLRIVNNEGNEEKENEEQRVEKEKKY